MATRAEAKAAFWNASKKDDAARKALTKWLDENSSDAPGGYVDDAKVEALSRKSKGGK